MDVLGCTCWPLGIEAGFGEGFCLLLAERSIGGGLKVVEVSALGILGRFWGKGVDILARDPHGLVHKDLLFDFIFFLDSCHFVQPVFFKVVVRGLKS